MEGHSVKMKKTMKPIRISTAAWEKGVASGSIFHAIENRKIDDIFIDRVQHVLKGKINNFQKFIDFSSQLIILGCNS